MSNPALAKRGVWIAAALAIGFQCVTVGEPTRIGASFTIAADASDGRHTLWLPWAGRNGHPAVLQPVGHFSNDLGPIQTLAVDESAGVVYAGQGSRMVVIDVSRPASPRELLRSDRRGAVIEDLRLAGLALYVAAGTDGMWIYDVSRPAWPSIVATYADTIHRVAANNELAFAVAGKAGDTSDSHILAFDVQHIDRPRLLDTLGSRGICHFMDVDLAGPRAFVSADVCDLFALEVREAGALTVVQGAFTDQADGSRLRVRDGVVFEVVEGATVQLRDADHLKGEGLGRVDRVVFADGETWYTDVTRDLAVQAGRLLMVGRFDRQPVPDDEGLWVVDVSDPRHPVLLAAAESAAPAAVAGTKSHIYVAGADGLLIYPAVP